MSEAQHTPGPWMYHKQLNGSLTFFGENGNRAILSAARLINQEANARLIATAPELLDALKGMLEVFGDEFGMGNSSVCDDARAAITKATAQQ